MNEMVSWQSDGLIKRGGDCLVLGHYIELFLHKYLHLTEYNSASQWNYIENKVEHVIKNLKYLVKLKT